jgi:hypothetical protein
MARIAHDRMGEVHVRNSAQGRHGSMNPVLAGRDAYATGTEPESGVRRRESRVPFRGARIALSAKCSRDMTDKIESTQQRPLSPIPHRFK